jgi:anti-sigma factor RsiW
MTDDTRQHTRDHTRDGTRADAHPPFERLSDLADGALAPAERDAVERHLAACAECHADAEALRRVLALAAAAPRGVEPPPEVWTGVRGQLAPRPARVRQLLWRRAPVLAAAAVLLAVASVRLLAARGDGAAEAPRTVATRPAERGDLVIPFLDTLRVAMGDSVARDALCGYERDSDRVRCVRDVPREPKGAQLVRDIAEFLHLPHSGEPWTRGTPVAVPSVAVMRQTVALDRAATELASVVRARESALSPASRASLTRSLGVVDTAVAEARAALLRAPADRGVIDALAAAQERRLELLQQAARLLSDD